MWRGWPFAKKKVSKRISQTCYYGECVFCIDISLQLPRGRPRSIVANVLDWEIAVNHFQLQSCDYVYFRANHHHHHHHHIALVAQISLTLSRHSSLSFIAQGRSSGQHPVSSHSCWMYVRAGRPAFARPCVGVHKSTSLMSSSLLLQQCPACLARLTWIVFVIGGRWPYSWCLVGCCRQDLFKIARSILV